MYLLLCSRSSSDSKVRKRRKTSQTRAAKRYKEGRKEGKFKLLYIHTMCAIRTAVPVHTSLAPSLDLPSLTSGPRPSNDLTPPPFGCLLLLFHNSTSSPELPANLTYTLSTTGSCELRIQQPGLAL